MAMFGRFSTTTTCSSIFSEKEVVDSETNSLRASLSDSIQVLNPKSHTEYFSLPDCEKIQAFESLMIRISNLVIVLEERIPKVSVQDECGIENRAVTLLGTGLSTLAKKRIQKCV